MSKSFEADQQVRKAQPSTGNIHPLYGAAASDWPQVETSFLEMRKNGE